MTTYTTLAGRTIEIPDLPRVVAAYLERVSAATVDPGVTPAELTALIYSLDNPIMDHQFVPGRAYVTNATIADPVNGPVYRVMSDMLGRKEMQARGVTEEQVLAPYTVDVPTAAEQLGVTQQAVRAAIDDWRLSAIYRNGQWWLHPNAIASFRISNRGRPAKGRPPRGAVEVRVGGTKGASLSIRVEGTEVVTTGKDDGATVGYFPAGWTRAVVKTTSDRGTRAFELEPAPGESGEIEHAGLFVRGPFRVSKKYNSTPTATVAWKTIDKTPGK